MWVKICGITNPADAEAAVEAGADAVGVVLAESPRRVTVDRAGALIESLPIAAFLLTVDEPVATVLDWATRTKASGVQPYGAHAPEVARAAIEAGLSVLRPVRVHEQRPDIDGIPRDETVLLDAGSAIVWGGSGRVFDWSLAAGLGRPFVLAGGLTPSNVETAVSLCRPAGVDVSSGVEAAPGRKDHAKIVAFVEGARA